jgi:dUTP pyrophosphatase
MKLKVFKLRTTAKLPVRAYPSDAGMDLFYCPDSENNNNFNKKNEIRIGPGSGSLIPTGLKIGVPEGYMLEIKNKSGVATKQRLVVGACVVDSGYDGEIFVNLNNIGTTVKAIAPGQKIAQAVLVPVETCGIEEIKQDNVYGKQTKRASGGFGSTGDF